MSARLGKFAVIIALVATTGAHWSLLQTIAWTTMFADNIHTAPLHEALVKTFDGKLPCPLCKSIAAGKKSERKNVFALQLQKVEFPPARENLVLIAPSQFELVPLADSSAESLAQPPPTPPPRGFFV